MTIVAAYVPRRFSLPDAEPRLFQVDAFSRLLGQCHWQVGKLRDTPVIVIVHGLEGSADSYYSKGIAEKAFHRGFHVVRLNQRNCGGTEKLTPTLYNSGMSGDYRAVLEELTIVDGFERIFFAGYSAAMFRRRCGAFAPCVRQWTCRRAPMPWSAMKIMCISGISSRD